MEVTDLTITNRGEYEGKIKAFVRVKNFQSGLEWIWTKEKFLNRKADFTEYYNDYKEDGVINKPKFKNYDPFFESPDTPTQIGTVIINAKQMAYLKPVRGDFKIVDLKNREAGLVNVELVPCDAAGRELNDNSVKNPETDLINRPFMFVVRLNQAKNINNIYEVDQFYSFSKML